MKTILKFIKTNYLYVDTIILSTIIVFTFFLIDANLTINAQRQKLAFDLKEGHVKTKEVIVTKEEIITKFIEENDSLINFYSETFQIAKANLINLIYQANNNELEFNELDIFATGTNYLNKDASILFYLRELENTNKEFFLSTTTPCNKDKEYILALIDYYTTIYTAVNPVIAKSIAHIESGYKSAYMLSKNNIFGGMSNGSLIKYKNIEYGVLRYIELLNNGYFSKGLTTVESICYKYNPIIINGVKQVNYPWVNNVTNVMNNYQVKSVNSFEDLQSLY